MMKIIRLLSAIILLSCIASVSCAYVTQIRALAVLQGEEQGVVSPVYLNLTKGNGTVRFVGNATVNASTIQSARIAAAYAASYVGANMLNYNFTYTIYTNGSSASGPSGGLAFALLAVSALQRRQLSPGFAVTGTISPDGSVGLIGGAYDKIAAAKAGGLSYVLVPAAPDSSSEALLYYLSQQVTGIPVVEVSNVTQALPFSFGSAAPRPLSINISQNYKVSALHSPNVTCSGCNISAFAILTNYTLDFSRSYISNITGNFSSAKSQLLDNLAQYDALQGKGYLYTAADFAFLDFIKAFMLYNARNLDPVSVGSVVTDVSSYCYSLSPPPLTDTNYEYVIGGNLRSMWANSTLNASQTFLSSEQTTDDAAQSLYDAGQALGWCKASDIEYQIAYSLGGNYVAVSPSIKPYVTSLMNSLSGYGSTIYLTSAEHAYASGDYATALYALEYEKAFGKPVPSNMTDSQIISAVSSSAASSNIGIWPTEFSIHSEFYLAQAMQARNETAKRNYLNQAYSTAILASGLSAANAKLAGSLVISNSTPVAQEILSIQQSMSQIYIILLMMLILMFVMFIALLVLALRGGPVLARSRKHRH